MVYIYSIIKYQKINKKTSKLENYLIREKRKKG